MIQWKVTWLYEDGSSHEEFFDKNPYNGANADDLEKLFRGHRVQSHVGNLRQKTVARTPAEIVKFFSVIAIIDLW